MIFSALSLASFSRHYIWDKNIANVPSNGGEGKARRLRGRQVVP
nr:MAG TPA: hypothetical protein [Caudoviricetes sp.]